MERQELINKGADAVRNTPHLFNAYKQFLIEDWGELPPGCFGCQFSSHFSKWKNQVLTNNIIPMEKTTQNTNKTYVLKDKSVNKYLYGEVYSNYSPDEHWKRYLEIKPDGKDLFLVLPDGVERSESDLTTEEDYKKKELSNSPTTEDVVVNEAPGTDEVEVNEDSEITTEELVEETEINSEDAEELTTEDVVEEKPKRGRKKQA